MVRTPRTVQIQDLGKDNDRADALSRRHDIAGIKTIEKGAILKITRTSLALE
jgi:hypothetical protein